MQVVYWTESPPRVLVTGGLSCQKLRIFRGGATIVRGVCGHRLAYIGPKVGENASPRMCAHVCEMEVE